MNPKGNRGPAHEEARTRHAEHVAWRRFKRWGGTRRFNRWVRAWEAHRAARLALT